jgi:cytoskeletal protein CcmA (bactofilin family)
MNQCIDPEGSDAVPGDGPIIKQNTVSGFQGLSDLESRSLTYEGTVIDGEQFVEEKLSDENMRITGHAVFRSFVDVDRLSVEGSAEFLDTLTCDEMTGYGNVILRKNLICGSASFLGYAEVFGDVHAETVSIAQQMKAYGRMETVNLKVGGRLTLSGKLTADTVMVKGSMSVRSIIRAIDVEYLANGVANKAVEIKAETVTVDSAVANPSDFALICDTVECDTANLAYTKADYVFCETCDIGPGSVIRVLECHNEPKIHEGASVGKILRF